MQIPPTVQYSCPEMMKSQSTSCVSTAHDQVTTISNISENAIKLYLDSIWLRPIKQELIMHNIQSSAKKSTDSKGCHQHPNILPTLVTATPTTVASSCSAKQMQLDQSMCFNLDRLSDQTDQFTALSCCYELCQLLTDISRLKLYLTQAQPTSAHSNKHLMM